MKDKIKEILSEYTDNEYFGKLIIRDTGILPDLEKIQVIIGPRRVGKTSAMFLTMHELKQKEQLADGQILYFNFEDERLQFRAEDLDLILQAQTELYPNLNLQDVRFFFDEVQAAPGWEKFLNRINETLTKKIWFTGSNSAVLHTKVKSVMRGRSLARELLPLSFREYCHFSGVQTGKYGKAKTQTIVAFQKYLVYGGFPETVTLDDNFLHMSYLQEYYNAMLLRDIVEYNQLSNYSYLRALYRHATTTIGKTVSIRRLFNQIKSQGYTASLNSLYEVMDMAENAYLFKRISKFDHSLLKSDKSDKKIYWIDNGLLNAITIQYTSNKGLLLENLVFWELYRKYGNVYNNNVFYYKDGTSECDFIVQTHEEKLIPVQVCWSLSGIGTKDRELKGLLKACAYSKSQQAWIICADEEDDFVLDGVNIKIIPAWKWLLFTDV
ncbi:ATP-binding protein [Agriterribacter sp.]|uniref:ATP-binding protein n=1 Tax=Agriterribacter sp. TaxID=2821509 RepID=UPI002C1856B5|nr:ATP-binding protein [Agriterribacter sp.]HRO47769.1 ATP-binding protein [Agriterribacter sp.]HRQ18345.1 ATP-binding protein [Agriterribacter sp.]